MFSEGWVADEGGTRSEQPWLPMTILATWVSRNANRCHARLATAYDSCLPVVVPSGLVFYLEERFAFSVEHSYMVSNYINAVVLRSQDPVL